MTSRYAVIGLLVILPTMLSPHLASAQTSEQIRLGFEINTIANLLQPTDNQSKAEVVDPNIAILQDYLSKKGSPLAPYAEHILKHENWKLVLAISNGESTMCKRQMYNNCWGVGGAWNLRRYASFADGFTDVNRLLTDKYVAYGADTPKEIARKYVGSYSPTWVRAVSQTLAQLNQLPLQN